MALTNKIPAKDWTVEIDDGLGTGTFVEIHGLDTLTFEPSSNRTDTTNNDSEGNDEGYISNRGLAITAEGDYIEDVGDGSRDPGQERAEELGGANGETGAASIVPFRLTSPGGTTYTFDVTVDMAFSSGGGYQDNAGWSATFTKTGAAVKA